MPPRLIIGAILAFWLGMTAWLIQREVVPMMLADASPTYLPDLTDEIGSPMVGWTVLRDGKRIGSATSKVEANDDRTYAFRSLFHFDNFPLGRIYVRDMEIKYRVTEDGKLLALSTQLGLGSSPQEAGRAPSEIVARVDGEVVDSLFEPRVTFMGVVHQLDKVDVREQGSIVNPMALFNRLRGLHAGKTWKISFFDPFRGVTEKFVGNFAKSMTIPAVIAEVKLDTVTYDRRETACFVIEYSEPGKEPNARTWVRKIDGLVLKQEANHGGFDLVLERIPH